MQPIQHGHTQPPGQILAHRPQSGNRRPGGPPAGHPHFKGWP
jgi:hypothetical protein